MAHVPGGTVRMQLRHMRRAYGCYPDPGTPPERWKDFLWGLSFDGEVPHDYTVEVRTFLIDEAEVSNAEFKRFLEASGYRPRHPENELWFFSRRHDGCAHPKRIR